MKKILILCCLIILTMPLALAGSVNRTITYYNDNKSATVSLSPTPYNEFDVPGYFITEYLPNGVSFIDTNADQYKIENSSLLMLKFNPSSANLIMTYTIKMPKDDGEYTFYGTFWDKNRNAGEIKAQVITIQNGNQNNQGASFVSSIPQQVSTQQEPSQPVRVEAVNVTKITAQQAQSVHISEQQENNGSIIVVIGLIIFLIVIVVVKKIKKMPVTYEFIEKK